MRYGGQSLRQATRSALATVEELGVTGGIIAVSRRGAVAIAVNSAGMYRAHVSSGRAAAVAIY